MDVVLRRMNLMIKEKKMDPLKVNLYAGKADDNGNHNNKTTARRDQKNKKRNRRKNNGRFLQEHNLNENSDNDGKRESEEDRDSDEPKALDEFQGVATRDIFLNQFTNSESARRIRYERLSYGAKKKFTRQRQSTYIGCIQI